MPGRKKLSKPASAVFFSRGRGFGLRVREEAGGGESGLEERSVIARRRCESVA
jgi:hypothetical protein